MSNPKTSKTMFEHGTYWCDNNREQHLIDSIMHENDIIADWEYLMR